MKISALALENVKRVKTAVIEPKSDGLTIVGGKNAQGKTTILDAIAFAFGGERMRPSNLKREGALGNPMIHIETDDGLVIERKGKNCSLTVTDRNGRRAGQTLLDAAVGKIAINLFRFLDSSSREKTDTLLGILGIGDELAKLDREEKAKYDTRLVVGREKDSKQKAAYEMPVYEDVPEDEVSVSEMIAQSRQILSRNGIREQARNRLTENEAKLYNLLEQSRHLQEMITIVQKDVDDARSEVKSNGEDESTSQLEANIANAEDINEKVRSNRRREELLVEADDLSSRYDELTCEIEDIRKRRIDLINGSNLPLVGLSIEDGELVYKGKKFDCWSGAEKMIAGTAIASAENPNCKFVLLDKLEQLDLDTLAEFDKYLKERGLQAIATRVSTGDECTIIIEDGEVLENENEEEY